MDVDISDNSFADNVTTYAGLLFAGTVLLTTPMWDSEGFCDHQRESYDVAQSRTLEDIFKGRERTETYYSDVSEACKAEGGWEFIGDFDNWRADVLLIFGILSGLAVLGILLLVGALVVLMLKDFFSDRFRRPKPAEVSHKKSPPKPKKKITPGIGNTGREIISWEGFKDGIGFDFYLANVDDIIEREHLSKGDYDDWFHRCAKEYLDTYPKNSGACTPSELAWKLSWAIGHIDKLYVGKSEPTGVKKKEKLEKYKERLELLSN